MRTRPPRRSASSRRRGTTASVRRSARTRQRLRSRPSGDLSVTRYQHRGREGWPVASTAMSETPTDDIPGHRYDARLASEIEARWQDRWDVQHTFWAPNPTGLLSEGAERIAGRDPLFV